MARVPIAGARMFARHLNTLRWSYRKTLPDICALAGRHAPSFVRRRDPAPLRDEIPVFTFHTVEPVAFEAQLRFLAANRYRTLSAEEFRRAIAGEAGLPPRGVLLSFDDGLASLWTVAFPLLQKYGFRGVSFIVPGCVPEDAPPAPTFADYERGRVGAAALLARERDGHALCSWQEIREMHGREVIEFQSHTRHHHLVPVGPEVVDFVHPRFDTYCFGNINVPVYRVHGRPDFARRAPLGTPVYRAEPRMAGRPAWLDDEQAREACVAYVRRGGEARFFERPGWRRRLRAVHQGAAPAAARLETPAEQEAAIVEDLVQSKREIESRLPGARVEHLCYPWYAGSALAVGLSQRAGYRVNYWGVVPGRPTNRAGDDLLHVPRLDERYLLRLPGEGRRSIASLAGSKVRADLGGFVRRFS